MADDTDRLTKLQLRKTELEQKIRQEKARRRDEERKLDTRRKIIAGGALLTEAEQNPDFAKICNQVLKQRIEKRDYHLFPDLFPPANDEAESGTLTGEFQAKDKA